MVPIRESNPRVRALDWQVGVSNFLRAHNLFDHRGHHNAGVIFIQGTFLAYVLNVHTNALVVKDAGAVFQNDERASKIN